MVGGEVVDGTDQIHPRVQRGGAPGQGPAPAGESRQALTEGGIESFNVSGVDHARAALRAAAELFDLRGRASENAALNTDHMPLNIVLDDLRNMKDFPALQARTAWLPCVQRSTEGI